MKKHSDESIKGIYRQLDATQVASLMLCTTSVIHYNHGFQCSIQNKFLLDVLAL